jgi:hypothetical protein
MSPLHAKYILNIVAHKTNEHTDKNMGDKFNLLYSSVPISTNEFTKFAGANESLCPHGNVLF